MRRALVSGAIFVGLLTPACWAGTTIYVNGTTGDDGWTGLCEVWDGGTCGPRRTIQAGINAAVAGDTVLVADGTYTATGNRDLDFHGKPITLRSAGGDPAACIIDCQGSGRGFYFHSGETAAAVVAGFTIRNGNSNQGGGVYCDYSSSPTLTNCTIAGNTAASNGGGVYYYYSGATLTNCTIGQNTAASGGGGVYCYSSNPTLTNCTITGNTAVYGGGVYWNSSSPTLTNCTIGENTAASGGGGVYCYDSSPTLTNCILWGDTPQELYASSGTATVTYSDVQGGYTGTGNINVEPGFAFSGDCHLLAGSPCIDAGTNAPSGGLPAQDADGNPRPLDGNGDAQAVADMGAYEFNPTVPAIALGSTRIEFFIAEGQSSPETQTLSVRNGGGGTLNWALDWQAAWLQADAVQGASTGEVNTVTLTADASTLSYGTHSSIVTVSDPQASNSPRIVGVVLYVNKTLHVPSEYAAIQAAIDAAIPGDEVLVADGTYTGTGNKNLDFHGKVVTVRSASGDSAACIIDCQSSGRGFYFHSNETASASVDGLTVRNGYPSTDGGGGIYCANASPTITNCTITGNTANGNGGAIYCAESGNPVISGCTITGNTAYYGGGIYCSGGTPAITFCAISGNTAGNGGGGIYCGSGNPVITNCTITGNTAGSGGGIYSDSVSSLIADSTISGNSASQGAGIYCSNGSAAITDCTISANLNGKGVYCANTASPIISGGAVTGNQGGGIWCGAGLTIADCSVTNNIGYGIDCVGALAMTSATVTGNEGAGVTCGASATINAGCTVTNNQGRGVSCTGALNITNGTITDNGDNGISCGNNSTITGGAVRRNGKTGISCGTGTTITGCPVEDNQSDGVYSSGSLAVADCVVRGNQGVGISCTTGTMDHCTVANNKGTGITCRTGAATVSDCTVSDNQGSGVACVGGTVSSSSVQRNQGTGLACGSGAVTISDCTLSDNTAPGDGGGIACGTGTITDCTVSGNVAVGRGGGVFGSASLIRSTITANEARSGGGIYCSGGSPIVEHCVVVSNVASGIFAGEGTGGGIHCQSASPTLINCLLARNIAANDGGGVYAGRAVLASCTVAGNTAVFLGGGLCVNTGTDYRTDARNCVFWGNSGCAGTQFAAIGPAELRVACSDAQGGPDAVYLHEGAELLWGWGNLQTDPLFRDPQTDDYRLGPGSPCVDAGDNFGALTALDLDGNPRRVDQPSVPDTGLGEPPIVDMGAYELQVRLVTQPGDANCDGAVDFDDIGPFVAALIGQTTYEAAYPKCAWLNADCNGDGTVDFDDINPFVKCLVNGGCP